MIRISALLCLAAGLAAVVTDPAVRAEMPWADPHGYTPVLVTIDSLVPRAVRLEVGADLTTAVATVPVPAGTSRHWVLLPPHGGDGYFRTDLRWRSDDGKNGSEDWISATTDENDVVVLVDPGRSIDEAALETGIDGWSSRSAGRYYGGGTATYERFDPTRLPDRWQAYPDDLVLLLHRIGVERMSPAQRRAIDDWARGGGLAAVVDGDPAALGLPHAKRVAGPLEDWLRWVRPERERRQHFSPSRIRVPGTEEVPVGAFALLAITFALVVGPLNLWWAVRRRQRWLLLITTPALSAATCLVLVVVNLVSEGLTTRRVADQLVWLDGQRHEAVVWTAVTSFAPFAQTSGEVDPAIEVAPIDPGARAERHTYRRRYRSDRVQGLGLDWTTGQALDGQWLPARINRRLLYTQPRALRQRLLLRRADDGYQLTNGLEVAIEELVWRDEDGETWSVADLAPGATAGLQPGGALASGPESDLGTLAAIAWEDAFDIRLHANATLAAPAVAVPGFGGIDERPPRAWLCGPLRPEDAP